MANVPAAATADDTTEEATLPQRPPRSPMTYWVALGLFALGATSGLILMTARRSARAEARGDELARLLLQEAGPMAPIDWTSEWQRAHLEARLVASALSSGLLLNEFAERTADDTPGISFTNKHYAIVLRPSPHVEVDVAEDEGDLPLEAVAFPREAVGPAKSIFFHPEDADRAYSRNLQSDYTDDAADRRPPPGMFHRRPDGKRRAWDYRAFDDERFLVPSRS